VSYLTSPYLSLSYLTLPFQESEDLARIGIATWTRLLHATGPALTSEHWGVVLTRLTDVLNDTLPHQLCGADARAVVAAHAAQAAGGGAVDAAALRLPFSSTAVVTKCKVQIVLLDASYEVVSHFSHMLSPAHLDKLLDGLLASISFARRFNADFALRQGLWEAGFMSGKQRTPPELLKQEARALKVYINVLLVLSQLDATSEQGAAAGASFHGRFLRVAEDSFDDYARRIDAASCNDEGADDDDDAVGGVATTKADDAAVGVRCMTPVVCALLQGILSFPDDVFADKLPVFFPHFAALVRTGTHAIRVQVADVLERRVGPSLGLDAPLAGDANVDTDVDVGGASVDAAGDVTSDTNDAAAVALAAQTTPKSGKKKNRRKKR
jgi:hypothetical protein